MQVKLVDIDRDGDKDIVYSYNATLKGQVVDNGMIHNVQLKDKKHYVGCHPFTVLPGNTRFTHLDVEYTTDKTPLLVGYDGYCGQETYTFYRVKNNKAEKVGSFSVENIENESNNIQVVKNSSGRIQSVNVNENGHVTRHIWKHQHFAPATP